TSRTHRESSAPSVPLKVTRRRGVGQYLLEEVLRNNPGVSCWWMADAGVEDRGVMTAFMQALGFTAQQGGWEKR
ncbi:aspartate 1-decarboxylase autocleavage activator PanM, partial [Escherichia coli]|uniref:aspartate 1-decarboxylase autocleavage activator PanM n=1 Tax=Escherichia coli TaxID=562 RepID=UPI000DED8E49